MVLLLLAMLITADAPAATSPGGVLEATITGTSQALKVELFLRNEADQWNEVAHKQLAPDVRQVRFDGLDTGVYQIRLEGDRSASEQFAMKVVVSRTDTRRIRIEIEPFVITGKVTHGGTELGNGGIVLRHQELHWRGGFPIAPDGTFKTTMWQRGPFTYSVLGPALPTEYADTITIDGPAKLAIDIPDGRVTGIVRDKAGAPVAGVTVLLETTTAERADHVKLRSDPEGRFDFTGIKYGRNVVRVRSERHLEPEPATFDLTANARLRELDIRLDAGREVAIVVIDRNNDPVANAKVFTVSDSTLRARTTTDEDGRVSVPVPVGEPATLFVVSQEGPFAMVRVARTEVTGRLQVHLPASSSSLLIRALTTDGRTMPPFSLLMRFNGELVPVDVADELVAVQGLQLMTGQDSEALLKNIPSGSYEFWPYRSESEAESIVAAGGGLLAPIQVNVRSGENKIAVKFARR